MTGSALADPNTCTVWGGTGWRKGYLTPHHPLEWEKCRACLGTGRADQKGEILPKPQE